MHGCHCLPPDMPQPGIYPMTLRLQDLRLARLSEPGILCVCVSSRMGRGGPPTTGTSHYGAPVPGTVLSG